MNVAAGRGRFAKACDISADFKIEFLSLYPITRRGAFRKDVKVGAERMFFRRVNISIVLA